MGKSSTNDQPISNRIYTLLFSGRVNLVDLQQAINVDFSHVESKVAEILKSDKSLTLVLGQLIDRYRLYSVMDQCFI